MFITKFKNRLRGVVAKVFVVVWLMIAYIALFTALLSRLTALACGFT